MANTQVEALKLALEALEIATTPLAKDRQKVLQAITAIKAELEAKDNPVQVSPLEFVEMVMEKEDCIGKPIIWAEWPTKENNDG